MDISENRETESEPEVTEAQTLEQTDKKCPACGQEMRVRLLRCPDCQTEVQGDFALDRFSQLSPDQLTFL